MGEAPAMASHQIAHQWTRRPLFPSVARLSGPDPGLESRSFDDRRRRVKQAEAAMDLALDPTAVHAGLGLGAASMLSVGPNNLMLIREGLVRGRAAVVASLVTVSYVLLISASIALASAAANIAPGWKTVLTIGGLAAIAWFAAQSLRAAIGRRALETQSRHDETLGACFRRVMAIVWLNPLTYLELLLVPAALCQSLGAAHAQFEFVAALIAMTVLYCYGYAFAGGLIGSVLDRRASLRLFDLASGLLLTGVAVSMASRLVVAIP